jgi:cathepsin B
MTSVGGDSPSISVGPKEKQFIQREMKKIFEYCSKKPPTDEEMNSYHQTEQVVDGILYHAGLKVKGKEYKLTFIREPRAKRRPHEEPASHDKPNMRDRFRIKTITPPPCEEASTAKKAASWEWGETAQFAGMTMAQISGYVPGKVPLAPDVELTEEEEASIPKSFSWRTHPIGKLSAGLEVQNQGACGACYAFAAGTAMDDRICIASKGKFVPRVSMQALINCAQSTHGGTQQQRGCHGGNAGNVYNAMGGNAFQGKQPKGMPASWCTNYHARAGACKGIWNQFNDDTTKKCPSMGYKAGKVGGTQYYALALSGVSKIKAIQKEIMQNGPAMMAMKLYPDFVNYKHGVYQHAKPCATCKPGAACNAPFFGCGGHAIKVIGWGVENGIPYWEIQNSWGESWGDKGFAKIKLGSDESSVETLGIEFGTAVVPNKCASKAKCSNMGSYDENCNCHCRRGFSGTTCTTCQAAQNPKCKKSSMTGSASEIDGRCVCTCKPGFHSGVAYDTNSKAMRWNQCGLKAAIEGSTMNVAQSAGQAISMIRPTCLDLHSGGCAGLKGAPYFICKNAASNANLAYAKQSCKATCAGTLGTCNSVTIDWKMPYFGTPGDTFVAAPCGIAPWNAKTGKWADGATTKWLCQNKSKYKGATSFCWPSAKDAIPTSATGAFTIWFYKYLGKNEFGQDKGWTTRPMNLGTVCIGETSKCTCKAPAAKAAVATKAPPAIAATKAAADKAAADAKAATEAKAAAAAKAAADAKAAAAAKAAKAAAVKAAADAKAAKQAKAAAAAKAAADKAAADAKAAEAAEAEAAKAAKIAADAKAAEEAKAAKEAEAAAIADAAAAKASADNWDSQDAEGSEPNPEGSEYEHPNGSDEEHQYDSSRTLGKAVEAAPPAPTPHVSLNKHIRL